MLAHRCMLAYCCMLAHHCMLAHRCMLAHHCMLAHRCMPAHHCNDSASLHVHASLHVRASLHLLTVWPAWQSPTVFGSSSGLLVDILIWRCCSYLVLLLNTGLAAWPGLYGRKCSRIVAAWFYRPNVRAFQKCLRLPFLCVRGNLYVCSQTICK